MDAHLRALVDLLCAGGGRFKAGQHLQQVEQCSEVGLLEEQQHGDVLLLGRRQTGGRQLDALPLPFSPWSSKRHKHHLGSKRQTVMNLLCCTTSVRRNSFYTTCCQLCE